MQAPVPAGTSVFEATPGARVPVRPLAHPAWLFWEDEDYQALFEHPSELLLIDAQTGRVLRRAALSWFPLINGRRPVFLSSRAAYHDSRNWIFSGHLPTVRSTHASDPAAHTAAHPPLVIQRGELKHDCLIMIGDRDDPILSGSFASMYQWAREVGLPDYPDEATNLATLKLTVAKAKADECDDVFLFIAGHGTPPPDWRDPKTGIVLPGGPPAVNLDSGAARRTGPNGWTVVRSDLKPDDLKSLVLDNPDIGFKVKIESCFSGRFADTLVDSRTRLPFASNLLDLELSSPGDRVSYGQIKVDTIDARGRVTGRSVPVTDNPFGAGEFTNGDYHGLEQWARSATEITKTDGDLAQGIADSYKLGLPFTAATRTNIAGLLPSQPQLFTRPPMFRANLESHELSDGFDVTGWTHGRFDTVQVDAPANDMITSFDAHGHLCALIDNAGTVYTNTAGGINLPPGRYIVAVRCDRKPVDDDIHIDVTLASGRATGQTVHVTIVKDGQVVAAQDLAVHP